MENRTQQAFARASLWLKGYHPSPADQIFFPKESKKTSRQDPEKQHASEERRQVSLILLLCAQASDIWKLICFFVCPDWVILWPSCTKGTELKSVLAGNRCQLKSLEKGSKEARNIPLELLTQVECWRWSQSFLKPSVLLFPKQLLPWSFFCVCPGKNMRGRSWAELICTPWLLELVARLLFP